MIAKERPYPMELLILEAIVRRFPPNNPRKAEFEKKLHQKRAGYKGERILDYHMDQIDHRNYFIMRDLRIPYNQTYFQIDALLISPAFILVIDSKYLAGTLIFQPEFTQLIRHYNEVQEIFQDPIMQTRIQASQLQGFLAKHQFPPAPIEHLAAITNPQAIIQNPSNNKEVSERVCRPTIIAYKIPLLEKKYPNTRFSKNDIKKMIKLLLKNNEPFIPQYSNLPLEEMVTGVQCPSCETFGMNRIHGSWTCNSCGSLSKDAHLALITDYFLIYGPTMTNKQFRKFAQIESSSLAKRLLSSANLSLKGSRKASIYIPEANFNWHPSTIQNQRTIPLIP